MTLYPNQREANFVKWNFWEYSLKGQVTGGFSFSHSSIYDSNEDMVARVLSAISDSDKLQDGNPMLSLVEQKYKKILGL